MRTSKVTRYQVAAALRACQEKKAEDIAILRLDKHSGAFTDYFVLCSGANPRQIQAISDEVENRLRIAGLRPEHTEGYNQAEWVLLDYVDFVVHIFSQKARRFYDLERLWRSATRLSPAELLAPEKVLRAAVSKRPSPAATTRSAVAKRRPQGTAAIPNLAQSSAKRRLKTKSSVQRKKK